MRLELTPDEADALRRLLDSYLGDLSQQIADAGVSRFRDELRSHREMIRGIAARLTADAGTPT